MDKLDYKILNILKENGRETASDISKAIHLSVSAVLDRIKKMEESGIIKGYTVRVDAKALGNDVTALMEISLEHPRFHDSFTDELERIHRTIKSIPGVSATRTHFVLKEIKNMYSAIPEEEKKRF